MKNSSFFIVNIAHHQHFGKPCLRKVLDAFDFEILKRHRNPTRGSCTLRAHSRKPFFWSARHSSGPSEHKIKRQQMINSWAKNKTTQRHVTCNSNICHSKIMKPMLGVSLLPLFCIQDTPIQLFSSTHRLIQKTNLQQKQQAVLLQSFIFISDWVAMLGPPSLQWWVKTMAQATGWLEQVQWQWSALGLDYT